MYSASFIFTSYGVSLIVLFIVNGIYCYEVISGVKKYLHQINSNDNVRSEEKSLEHDANGADHGFHPFYVSFYLVYQLLLIILLSSVAFIKFDFLIETVLGVTGFYLIMIVVWKPYKLRIHNIAIVGH